jgi:hypothetical protein
VIRDSALGELAAHSWPENVRELVRVLTDARPSARGSSITAELIRKVLRCTVRHESSPDVLPLDRVELDYIVAALALCDGNQTLAARRLGIHYNQMKSGTQVLAHALAILDCVVVQAHIAGDHTIFVGEVKEVSVFEGSPLLYFRGRYGACRMRQEQ